MLYLPSWTLNYSKTLYNKPFKEALSLRMPLLFLNAAFLSKEQFLFLHYMFSLSSDFNINTFCCSQYRSYNKGIPSYFLPSWQAPGIRWQWFGKADDCSGIWFFRNYPPKERLFLVLIFTNNLSKCYKVYFGNEHGFQNIAAVTKIKQVIWADFFFAGFEKFSSWPFNIEISHNWININQ